MGITDKATTEAQRYRGADMVVWLHIMIPERFNS